MRALKWLLSGHSSSCFQLPALPVLPWVFMALKPSSTHGGTLTGTREDTRLSTLSQQ